MAHVRNTTVALVSDTHGTIDPRIVESLASCDMAVHAGDIGAAAVLQSMQLAGLKVLAVRGNNDTERHWQGRSLEMLAALPEELALDLPGGQLLVVHGHRAGPAATRHRWLRRHYPAARAIVHGHSHRLMCDTEAEPWVLNPGAAGRSRTYGGPSCLILQATARSWYLQSLRFTR